MNVTTFTAIVENGQIRLPADVRLPENGGAVATDLHIRSPHFMHAEQAGHFVKWVVEER